MLKINILCIGKLKEEYWRAACAEYAKRLRPYCHFSIQELPECRLPGKPSRAQISASLEKEGKRILSATEDSATIALCIEGNRLSSEQFAEKLERMSENSPGRIDFIIGSSYGLSESVKRKAALCLSFSPMTFPHQLARVLLCEQIYRAFQINTHGKYHK